MQRSERRRIVIWGVLGILTVALLVAALVPRAASVDLAEVRRGDLVVTLDHEGMTRVRDRFTIAAPFHGRVQRITLEPGDLVTAGETVLAAFRPTDPVPLDLRSRTMAEAQLRAGEAALDRARAEREWIHAEREFALAAHQRARQLAAEGFLPEEALEAAATEARARSEALAAADAAVRAARHELEAAHAALLEAGGSGKGLTAMELRSPVSGVVLRRMRESEAPVPAGEPLLEVADPADLEVIADYLSADAVRIRPGMPVAIEQWGGELELRGRVQRVEPSGFMKISALGVEEQRVWVVVDLEDPREAWQALGDGYRVEVRVVTTQRSDVVLAPTSALFRRGDGWAVFVRDGSRVRLRAVTVGERTPLEAEILDGLAPGEQVVVHPSDAVADGRRVAPVAPARDS